MPRAAPDALTMSISRISSTGEYFAPLISSGCAWAKRRQTNFVGSTTAYWQTRSSRVEISLRRSSGEGSSSQK